MRDFVVEGCLYFVLFFSVFFFGSVSYPAFLLVSGFCFLIFFLQDYNREDFEKISKMTLVLFSLLMIWILIQTFLFSEDVSKSLYQMLKWMSLIVLFLFIQKMKYSQMVRIVYGIIFMGILCSLYAFYEVMSGHEHVLWEAKTDHLAFLTGTFRNRNHFAGFIELALGASLGLTLRSFDKKNYVYFFLQLFLCLLLFVVLVRTGSRSGLMCFMLSLFLLSLFIFKKNTAMGVLFLTLTMMGVFAGFYLGYDILTLRLNALVDDLPSLEGRLAAWQSILEMAKFYFFTGVGLGNFGAYFPNFQPQNIIYGWQHAHQDYLELLIEIGFPGLLLLILTQGSIFFFILSKALKKNEGAMYIVLGLLTGCFSLLLHGFMDFNFAVPSNALLFMTFLAVSYRLCKFEKKTYVIKKRKTIKVQE